MTVEELKDRLCYQQGRLKRTITYRECCQTPSGIKAATDLIRELSFDIGMIRIEIANWNAHLHLRL